MSGKFISTGLLTNKGLKQLDINPYLNQKIKDIVIHIIPLSTNVHFLRLQLVGGILKWIISMVFNPSLTHIAIQLNLENSNDILLIEYGQYLTIDSNLNNLGILTNSSFNSSKEPRINENGNIYFYINNDGVRITLFTNEHLKMYEKNFFHNYLFNDESDISRLISHLMAIQYYNISIENYLEKEAGFNSIFFYRVECDINNKIEIKELIKNFKGERWGAKKYNFFTHNCQTFAAQVIEILKAVRKNEEQKIRMVEKSILPGSIINALWHNEKLSIKNTLGRIPIFGFFYDLSLAARDES